MTAIFLRPVATDATGNWRTDADGTDLHTAIDEATRDDDDFIRSGDNPDGDLCRVRLGIEGEGDIDPPGGGVFTIFADTLTGDIDVFTFGPLPDWADMDNANDAAEGIDVSAQDTFNNIGIVRAFDTEFDSAFITQAGLKFDTSGIVSEIASVELSLFVKSTSVWGYPTFDATLNLLDRDWGGTIDVGDWLPSSGFSSHTVVSSRFFAATPGTNAYLTWGSSPEFISAIGNAGDFTNLWLVDANQGTQPTLGENQTDLLIGSQLANEEPFLFIDATTGAPVTIRYTAGKAGPQASSVTINQVVRLVQDSITIAEWTHNDVSATLALHEQELTEAEADDVDWDGVNADTLPLFLEFVATRAA